LDYIKNLKMFKKIINKLKFLVKIPIRGNSILSKCNEEYILDLNIVKNHKDVANVQQN